MLNIPARAIARAFWSVTVEPDIHRLTAAAEREKDCPTLQGLCGPL